MFFQLIMSKLGYYKLPKLPVEAVQISISCEEYFKHMVNSVDKEDLKRFFSHMLENQKALTAIVRIVRGIN